MDKIIFLDEGRVTDHGTHAELLSRPGPYRSLWDRERSTGPAQAIHSPHRSPAVRTKRDQ